MPTEIQEFFVPSKITDLENAEEMDTDKYCLDAPVEFEIPSHQQLDDLTRMFDALFREKSPTALFSNRDLFSCIYSYIKGMHSKESNATEVNRVARHKICHETGERMRKLLQVCSAFVKKNREKRHENAETLELCLRSTLKMYLFILCNTLLASAPSSSDDETGAAGGDGSSQSRSFRSRKRKRETDAGFGNDNSGVDLDGRELALTGIVEVCSPDITALWPNGSLEDGALNLVFRTALHMITQKANIDADAQSIASVLSLLLARVCNCILSKNESLSPVDLVSPMVELALKSEPASLFLTKLVSDIELEEGASTALSAKLLSALFENMTRSAVYEAASDPAAAKNVATFFCEVSKKCVSAAVKNAELILPIIQSENYDIRKAAITCLAEMIIQRYSGPSRNPEEDRLRGKYLNELLFRVMDINPFVRNHTLHVWSRLIEAKAVPKRYHLAVASAFVGRLEDRNYLVRDSAMAAISEALKKNWFGHVLSRAPVQKKLEEALTEGVQIFGSGDKLEPILAEVEKQFQPLVDDDASKDLLGDDQNETTENEEAERGETTAEEAGASPVKEETTDHDVPAPRSVLADLPDTHIAALHKIVFYKSTLHYVELMCRAMGYACTLLDSKTERDVIEAIKLVVTCSEYRLDGGEQALLKVLVMVFEGELKIQLAVRDAFVEVVFTAFSRVSASSSARAAASAQKLISILKYASEGEVSAVDRVFGLLKLNPTYSRAISESFLEAVWGIAEGSLDSEASWDERRTAMRVYSLLCRHYWKDLRTRKENLLMFLSTSGNKDNTLLSYVFNALQNESLDPQFRPIPSSADPSSHPVLRHLVTHLCRPTTAIASWMGMAESAISAIHHLCEVPAAIYSYVLEYVMRRAESEQASPSTRAQLFVIAGSTALKQLVAVESAERQQLKALDEAPQRASGGANRGGGGGGGTQDVMQKQLGIGSTEFKRSAIQELAAKRKLAIIAQGTLWERCAAEVVTCCKLKPSAFLEKPFERVCAVKALCLFMIVSEEFCAKHLSLLFGIVAEKSESWVVKTNIVIALGDLACVHPNLLGPYLNLPTSGFFKLLVDDDLRVRAVTIQVCSHLVLGEMLRIRDHLYTIVKLVADPDETIANNAVIFVQNLALKEKEKTGNLIPPLITQLSGIMPTDKFQMAMKTLLERVEGDKPTDSLIERLCQRFDTYSERSKKKLQLARNVAFALSELSYVTERAVKRIMSETCYQQYKHWLRDAEVFDYFKTIATKAKKSGRAGAERRDKTIIEEWEARMAADANPRGDDVDDEGGEDAGN